MSIPLAVMPLPSRPLLDKDGQNLWLKREIPHRVCAALTWLEMTGQWKMEQWQPLQGSSLQKVCLNCSVQEGRLTAIRWLIEFIGLTGTDTKPPKPVRKKPHPNGRDVVITGIDHGTFHPNTGSNAEILAKVWKGCSQASMHATSHTSHPDVGPRELAEALAVVIAHLEQFLYQPNGLSLFSIVREKF